MSEVKVFPGPNHSIRPAREPERMPSLRACGPTPPRGGRPKGACPSGERPGDKVKAGFLGGARSPRPDGTAIRMPRHPFPTRSDDDGLVA
jgi:hypothetical protein